MIFFSVFDVRMILPVFFILYFTLFLSLFFILLLTLSQILSTKLEKSSERQTVKHNKPTNKNRVLRKTINTTKVEVNKGNIDYCRYT